MARTSSGLISTLLLFYFHMLATVLVTEEQGCSQRRRSFAVDHMDNFNTTTRVSELVSMNTFLHMTRTPSSHNSVRTFHVIALASAFATSSPGPGLWKCHPATEICPMVILTRIWLLILYSVVLIVWQRQHQIPHHFSIQISLVPARNGTVACVLITW